jgi:hypothetical protein
MTDKPRIRVPAGSAGKAWATNDSFQNFAARIGLGTDNLQSAATYGFNPITRNRQLLEWMYGGSWVVQKTVDLPAEDMTRAGVEIQSDADPDEVEELRQAQDDLGVWPKVSEAISWGRLYGGAIAVFLIDGQRLDKPLRSETVGKGQFKGLVVLDRWMVNPSLNDLVTAYGPELGDPKYYDVVVDGGPIGRGRIHHSRVIRLEGNPQPYWRKIAENGWGLSVIETLYDRLVAFDSTTNGAAQLVHKAHLRTLKIEKLREIIAAGGKAMEGVAKQVEMIRLYQTNEGLTLLDASDEFDALSYTFTGLDVLLLQFAQQLAGATGIPLVRFFGEAPAGLNSTGESDFRNYYDGIAAQQEKRLRRGISKLLRILHMSVLGRPVDKGFRYKFVPLWQMSETDKADVAQKRTAAVTDAFDKGVIGRPAALKELRQGSDVTGVFSNITDEEIDEAESEPPPSAEGFGPDEGEDTSAGADDEEQPAGGPSRDHIATFALHGLGLVIETPKGAMREGPGWTCTMAAHYGYIQGTWSAEGRGEEMDCFVGPHPASQSVFVIDQMDPAAGGFDEHKCMLGYLTVADAVRDYIASYADYSHDRIGGVTAMTVDAFKAWLRDGDLTRPVSETAQRMERETLRRAG